MQDNQTEQQNIEQAETEQQSAFQDCDQQPVATPTDTVSSQQPSGADDADFLPTTSNDGCTRRRNRAVDTALTVALVVMIVILITMMVLRCFVVCRISVSGESMMPNFHDKQIVWVDKRNTELHRGDVVVLYKRYVKNKLLAEFAFGSDKQSGGQYEKLIKRVVALEGDKLWVEQKDDDYILVIQTPQGEIIYEDYYTVDGQPAQFYTMQGELTDIPTLGILGKLADTSPEKPFVVMQGYFFFLGDNRHNSADSRSLGALPLNRVYGIVK